MIVFRICAKHHTTAYLDIFTVDKNNQLQPVESFGSALYGKKKEKKNSAHVYTCPTKIQYLNRSFSLINNCFLKNTIFKKIKIQNRVFFIFKYN